MTYNYNQPSQGTEGWHTPVNENFSNLEGDAFKWGDYELVFDQEAADTNQYIRLVTE